MNEQQLQTLRAAIDAHRTAKADYDTCTLTMATVKVHNAHSGIVLEAAIQRLKSLMQEYGYSERGGQLSYYAVYHQYAQYFDQYLYDEGTGRWHPKVGVVPGWAVLPMAPLL
jgi:hypothetical protein